MMLDAILLYGSKARNEGGADSDTDLMGIALSGKIKKSYDSYGVSVHIYPKQWLLAQAELGSLFLLHITLEAVPLFDPHAHLADVRKRFRLKSSYLYEMEVGARVVLALTVPDSKRPMTPQRRARYFWGLRTCLIAATASEGIASFSAKALSQFCGVDGLEGHIAGRKSASLADCQHFGKAVISALRGVPESLKEESSSQNLSALLLLGGIGAVTAGHEIYGA